jgi:hypothetical protein
MIKMVADIEHLAELEVLYLSNYNLHFKITSRQLLLHFDRLQNEIDFLRRIVHHIGHKLQMLSHNRQVRRCFQDYSFAFFVLLLEEEQFTLDQQ